jgi:hypothetical protein
MKRIVFTELPEVTGAELTDNSSNTPKLSATDNTPLFAGLDTNAPLLSATTNTPAFFEVETRYHLWFTFDDPNYFRDLASVFDVAYPYITDKRFLDLVGVEDLPRKRLPLEYYEDFFYPGEERFQAFVRSGPPSEKVNALSTALLSTIQQYYLDKFSAEDDYLAKLYETTLISEEIFYSDLAKRDLTNKALADIAGLVDPALILNGKQSFLLDLFSTEDTNALLQSRPITEALYSTDLLEAKMVGNPRERVYFKDSPFVINGDTEQLRDTLYISTPLQKLSGKNDRRELAYSFFISRNYNIEPADKYDPLQTFYDIDIDWKPKRLFDTVNLAESSLIVSNPLFVKDTIFNSDLAQQEFLKYLYESFYSTDFIDFKPSLGKTDNIAVRSHPTLFSGESNFALEKLSSDDTLAEFETNIGVNLPRLYSTFAYTGTNSDIPVFKTLPAHRYPIEFREYWRDNFNWAYPDNFPGRPEERAGLMSGDEGRIYLEGTYSSGGPGGPFLQRYEWTNSTFGQSVPEGYVQPYRWATDSGWVQPQSTIFDSGGRRINLYNRTPAPGRERSQRRNLNWTGKTYWEILNDGVWGYISKQFGLVALHPKKYQEDLAYTGISLFNSYTPKNTYFDKAYAFFNDRTTDRPDIEFDMQANLNDYVGVQSIFKNNYKREAEDFFYEKDGGALVLGGKQNVTVDKADAEDTRHPHHISLKYYTNFDFFDAEASYPKLTYEYGQQWYALVEPPQGAPYIRNGFVSEIEEAAYWADITQMVHTVFADDSTKQKYDLNRIAPEVLNHKDSVMSLFNGAIEFLKDPVYIIDNGIVKFDYKLNLAIPEAWVYIVVDTIDTEGGQVDIYGWVNLNADTMNEEIVRNSETFYRKADYVRNFTDSVQHADSGTAFVEIYCSEAWSLESYVGEDGTHAAF